MHRKSYYLAKDYDAVCIETLNMQAISRQLKFGKSVMDNSYGKFQNMLDYKLYFQDKKTRESKQILSFKPALQ